MRSGRRLFRRGALAQQLDLLSLATGAVFGLASAVRAGRLDLSPALKSLRGSSTAAGRTGPRKTLAVAQVTLSLVLIIGAALFVRTLWRLNSHDAGFPRDRVLVVRIEPAGSDQRNRGGGLQRLDSIYTQLLERFVDSDFVRNAPPVLVVNETFARTWFNGEDPIGKKMGPAQIVGIVKDSKYTSLRGPTPPTSYVPFLAANTGRGQMILHVRTSVDPNLIAPQVRAEVWKADPTVPQFDIHRLAEEVDGVLIRERLTATLSTVLFVGILAAYVPARRASRVDPMVALRNE